MDRSAQLEELEALKSIYYAEEFQVIGNYGKNGNLQAVFWAFLKLSENYMVKYLQNLESDPSYINIKHLPPIELQLTLPADYPSKNPPDFMISCQWLHKSKISHLCKKLDEIWSENDRTEIIYTWCDFLKNDSLSFLGYENELDLTELCFKHLPFIKKLQRIEKEKIIMEENKPEELKVLMSDPAENFVYEEKECDLEVPLNSKVENSKTPEENHDKRAVLNLSLKMSPIKILENYNTEREKVEFLKTFYTCNICFSDKLGRDCTQFKDCNHVFCLSCVKSYFTIKIEDGMVQSIKCPEDKCTSEALPSQIKEVVSEELFARYDSVLLSVTLDTLNDIIYCPRRICQYPVSKEAEENMALCPNCQYVFCITCRMVYHGVEPCQYKASEVQKLIEQYETGSDAVRTQMEKRYSKKYLETLINCKKAETWVKENCKTCPRCDVAIEKSQGCNKMVCWNCNAYFCWLCCSLLDKKNPYSHFSDAKSPCANKLFHLVYNFDDDEEDWDWINNSEDEWSESD